MIGIGCRFPGADGPEAFWALLSEGVDAVGEPPSGRRGAGQAGAKRAGFLEQVDRFDAAFFGVAPREAIHADPQQRLLLEVAWEALEDAGLAPERLRGGDVGVFVGVSTNDYGRRGGGIESAREAYTATGNALSIAANRLSYVFDFRGPSMAIDTACSSSLVALHLACESLRRGESRLALAGGVSVILSGEISETFAAAGFLSPGGRCKAFDASADGYVRGEGVGVVVLKPLARALADGDPVYAVIRGSAVNQDGRSNGLTAPNREAQEAVLRAAYRRAAVTPGAVDYVEAHGTGTLLGDPIEASALAAVVGEERPQGSFCRVGSVKTNVGHLEAAAGIAGVIKVALALHRGWIPPSLHFRTPNPHIPFDALSIRVQTELGPWPSSDRPSLAGVSAFGFGGTNAHAVLESAPLQNRARADEPVGFSVIPLSARSPEALVALGRSFRALLDGGEAPSLADMAHTAGARRGHHEHRLAIVASDRAMAVERLDGFLRGETATGRRPPNRRLRCAFVFSGQGSQWWGMGRGLVETEPVVRDVLDDLDARFRPLLGWSILDELAAIESRSRLEETGFGQPVVFALQVALAALLNSWGIAPDAVVGHSLGEVAAAHVAGALGLDDAVRVVAHRARLMQTTTGQGKTAAVALSADDARQVIASDPDRLALAAINGPRASVISGDSAAVLALVESLRGRGVFAKVISGHCAFHGPQMEPIRGELRKSVEGIQPRAASVPIVSSVTGEPIEGAALDPEYWSRNLRETVQFAAAASVLVEGEYDVLLEIGPHPALGAALLDILQSQGRTAHVLATLRRGEPARSSLPATLGALYTHGFPVDWTLVETGGRFVRLPRYPFQRERFWLEVSPAPVYRLNGHGYANGNGHTNGHGNGNGNGHSHADRSGLTPVSEPPDSSARSEPAGFFEIEWQARERSGKARTTRGEPWVVFEDSSGAGAALVAALEARGHRCVRITPADAFMRVDESAFRIDPLRSEDVRRLLAELGPVASIVHFWNLDAPGSDGLTADQLHAAQRLGCESVVALVQALANDRVGLDTRVWVVTAGAQPAGESPGSIAIAQAPIWGLGRSLALERSAIWGGLIDLDPSDPAGAAHALADELCGDGAEDQVAFRHGQRYVARLVRRQRVAGLPEVLPIRPDGTYLITGGLGELGLKVAQRLVEQGRARLVLVGRRGLPDRAAWDALPAASEQSASVASVRAMERLGATIYPAVADVADRSAMAALFDDVRRVFPPIRGVIHAAGVVAAPGTGSAGFDDAVLRPKVGGTWILHELTRDQPLDFFVAFSSVASVLGAKEGDYAAANQFLDSFAHYRRTLGLPALSINWGPWEGVGMAADAARARAFRVLGVKPLRVDDGLDALAGLVASGAPQGLVADVEWNVLKALYGSNGRRPLLDALTARDRVSQGEGPRFAWRGERPEDSRKRLLGYLRERLAAVLKLEPERIDPERPIDTMGLDSLMAIELKNTVETDLGRALPLAALLQGPTLEQLAGRMLDQLVEGSDPTRSGLESASSALRESPLSAGQRALWSLHQLDPEGTAYHMVGAVRIAGALDAAVLRRSARRLVERHASLRTTFSSSQGEPIQRIDDAADIDFRYEETADEERLIERLDTEARRPFDLERGPLFRIHLFRRSEQEHALLLALHHIVADFWSIAVLLDELGQLYPAELADTAPELPAPTVSYADFARWQAQLVEGPEGQRQWAYWRDPACRSVAGAQHAARPRPAAGANVVRGGPAVAPRFGTDAAAGSARAKSRRKPLYNASGRLPDPDRAAEQSGRRDRWLARRGTQPAGAGGSCRLLRQHAADPGAGRAGHNLRVVSRPGSDGGARGARKPGLPVPRARRAGAAGARSEPVAGLPGDVRLPEGAAARRPRVHLVRPPGRGAADGAGRAPGRIDRAGDRVRAVRPDRAGRRRRRPARHFGRI